MLKNSILIRVGILLSSLTTLFAQTKVVGYIESWGDPFPTMSQTQIEKLTHVNFSFVKPNSNGSLQSLESNQISLLQSMVSTAHGSGKKAIIALGGWNTCPYPEDCGGNPQRFRDLAANATYRTAFVNNVDAFCDQYNLDGADMDWEFPGSSDVTNFGLLMSELSTKMHSENRTLSMAVTSTSLHGQYVNSTAINACDFINIMCYDGEPRSNHSSYQFALDAFSYWNGTRGVAYSKLTLGVPFYAWGGAGYGSSRHYKTLLANNSNAWQYSNLTQDGYDWSYNSEQLIKDKTQLAKSNGAGVMIWAVNHDALHSTGHSLLSAIHTQINSSNNAPSCNITSPANNASFSAPASVTINANATDSDGSISKVEFFQGSTKLGEDATSPYSYAWTNVSAGTYSLTVKAADNSNAVTTSSAISITVSSGGGGGCTFTNVNTNNFNVTNGNNFLAGYQSTVQSNFAVGDKIVVQGHACSCEATIASMDSYNIYLSAAYTCASGTNVMLAKVTPGGGSNQSPTTSITSPSGGATYTAPASVTINANASDPDGSITKVEFFQGSTKLGEDASSPYSYTWSSVSAGSYSLTVKATDNAGAVTTSSAVSITVNAAGNSAPTCSITSPSNGATFTAPATVTINANAADSDGNITKVEFFQGATKLGEDASSPYSYSWTSVSAGSYTLTVKATDNGGAVTTSSAISITVNSGGGGGCTASQWTMGNASYTTGTVVKNTVGGVVKSFTCLVGGWCQCNCGDYEPGNGWAGSSAWQDNGVCNSRIGEVDMEEFETLTAIVLHPNPSNGLITISGNAETEIVSLSISNTIGEELYNVNTSVNNGLFEAQLNLSELNNGIYIVRATIGNSTIARKVVKN